MLAKLDANLLVLQLICRHRDIVRSTKDCIAESNNKNQTHGLYTIYT